MPAAQAAHTLRLDAGHAEEILRVREVGGELGQLGMQLCLDAQR